MAVPQCGTEYLRHVDLTFFQVMTLEKNCYFSINYRKLEFEKPIIEVVFAIWWNDALARARARL
jgi:hypothetical protein